MAEIPQLTPPGEIFTADNRSPPLLPPPANTLRLLQWNIERGYQLAGIIEELRHIDADIISLQEIDVGCERSGSRDVGVAIAKALNLNYAFLSEFEELHSPARSARDQGGGVHGNAILSKFGFQELAVVRHRHHPVDWNDPTHPRALTEPRRGERAVLRATVATPQGPLVVYCAHLEVFCGMLSRVCQLADIFADSRVMAARGLKSQAILGDLNSMAHGVARLSPSYCCDRMRFMSLGYEEGVMWERHVLAVQETPEPTMSEAVGSGRPAVIGVNKTLLHWGVAQEFAQDAVNPGFACPFPAAATVTLDNPKYRFWGVSFMRGKLDWAMLRGCEAVATKMGNLDYALSDHRWLLVEARLLG